MLLDPRATKGYQKECRFRIFSLTSPSNFSASKSISSSSISICNGSTGSSLTAAGSAGGDFDRDGPATGMESLGGGVVDLDGAVGVGTGMGVTEDVRIEAGSGTGTGIGAAIVGIDDVVGPALLSRYPCTSELSACSEMACKLATIRSVTSAAGSVVKSNEARNDADAALAPSSSLTRFDSGGSGPEPAEGGRFREASRAALRCFSSNAALSIRKV